MSVTRLVSNTNRSSIFSNLFQLIFTSCQILILVKVNEKRNALQSGVKTKDKPTFALIFNPCPTRLPLKSRIYLNFLFLWATFLVFYEYIYLNIDFKLCSTDEDSVPIV